MAYSATARKEKARIKVSAVVLLYMYFAFVFLCAKLVHARFLCSVLIYPLPPIQSADKD